MVGFLTAAADLRHHQEQCERAAEQARREAREDAAETRRILERMEDRLAKSIDALKKELSETMSSLHAINQRDIRNVWTTMRVIVGGCVFMLVTFTIYLLEHGGLAALVKGL
jgi:hypothetical protein